jgi:hypothetical protein
MSTAPGDARFLSQWSDELCESAIIVHTGEASQNSALHSADRAGSLQNRVFIDR